MNQSKQHLPPGIRALIRLEQLGNRLPSPVLLFIYLILAVMVISLLAAWAGFNAVHPNNGQLLQVKSVISLEGLHWLLANGVSNFMSFAPVGPVVVVMLGFGIAEHSGLLSAALRRLLNILPDSMLTFGTVLVGVLSSIAVDAGYVVVIPLSGVIFYLAGRSPVLGMAACFAGVSGGFSANLLIGPVDAILAGISTEAAALVDPAASVSALDNYYFIVMSVFFISISATLVTQYWVAPAIVAMGLSRPNDVPELAQQQNLSTVEKTALFRALVVLLLFVALIGLAVVPESGWLRHAETGAVVKSPFMSGLILLIAMAAGISGYVYGRCSGVYESFNQVVEGMEQGVKTLAGYLVLMFFAAQFVHVFSWSNLGPVVAINGAQWLQALQLPSVLTLILFVLLAAGINLLIGSASAKWAVLAPVFVPMLMLMGINPEVTQAAYRVGDSSTNIITPLMPYFPLVLALMQRYHPQLGIGSVLAIMLPYSLVFLLGWSLLLAVWVGLGWPLGPSIR